MIIYVEKSTTTCWCICRNEKLVILSRPPTDNAMKRYRLSRQRTNQIGIGYMLCTVRKKSDAWEFVNKKLNYTHDLSKGHTASGARRKSGQKNTFTPHQKTHRCAKTVENLLNLHKRPDSSSFYRQQKCASHVKPKQKERAGHILYPQDSSAELFSKKGHISIFT